LRTEKGMFYNCFIGQLHTTIAPTCGPWGCEIELIGRMSFIDLMDHHKFHEGG